MFDLLIRNARVLDGTGGPWFRADVGVSGGRIAAVRRNLAGDAARTIEAADRILAPGFIDMHTHSDLRVFRHPDEDAKLMQGITTALIGQDGLSVAPLDDANKEPMMRRVSGLLGTYLEEWPWNTVGEYLSALEKAGPATNTMTLVPHGAVRSIVVGWENRPASPSELGKMQELLAAAMKEGGCGFSTGLIYPPGMYADRKELVALCRTTSENGGFFVVHMRNEADFLLDSIREVVGICLDAECPLHVSHLKVAGKRNWGKAQEALSILEDAREKGLEVTFDQYPYTAGSTMLDAVIPPRFHAGGTGKLLERLQDPKIREEIRKVQEEITFEPWENWIASCGWEGILVNSVKTEKNRFAEGKTVAEAASEAGKSPLDFVCDLLVDEDNAVTMTQFYGCEDDVRTFMQSPCMTLCSDAIVGGKPHPRAYGSTARYLGKYVREEKVLPLAEAVRHMTALPASRLGLQDRGIVREGNAADLVLFDPGRVIDRGTFAKPDIYPVGIDLVVVNGNIAMEDGKLAAARSGRVIRA